MLQRRAMSEDAEIITVWNCAESDMVDALATAVGELVDEHAPTIGMVIVFDRKGDAHTYVVGEMPPEFYDDPNGTLSELFADMSEALDPFEDDVRARN
jgi:diadenosine tetraphosphatase ApaH/serine/threonine PP2A family protein phosphatase